MGICLLDSRFVSSNSINSENIVLNNCKSCAEKFSPDKMVHGDFGIDLEAVWNITVKDVSSLKPLIAKI